MFFENDRYIRLEYSDRDGLFHFAEVTEARAQKYPALINKISQNMAWDFTGYAFKKMGRSEGRLLYGEMKELLTQWIAKYMARKRKFPLVPEYYKLIYCETSRRFSISGTHEKETSVGWLLIANRVHIDTIIDFTENARRVFYDHTDYYPDKQAVRYALQMWIAYHAETAP